MPGALRRLVIRSLLLHCLSCLLLHMIAYERRKVLATRVQAKRKFKPLLLLLLLPFIALCWPPFYNSVDPEFVGIPFFYWYQLLWVIITAIITAVVYLLDN